ncbi:NAD(P)-dependent oxidoreductase [Rhodococcus globerulus]|uniref:NAD(P)-dependent oxidoreductase n=1 Tax=Rhodococcus globerulus TaxID=33008 RepID=UPI001F486964|nr:NAD(P)-dependent oxidoreductase [Rhodococcus globerulus]MCE4266028.1 dehydrogenase [Rhodococcus globerulus]
MKKVLLLTADADNGLGSAIRDAVGSEAEIVRLPERTAEALHALLPMCDVVVGDWSGDLPLGKQEAELGRQLLLVQQPGAGTNFIDVDAWRAFGVPVANTPGANAESVAEWAVLAAGALCRSMFWAHNEVTGGSWPQESILTRDCRDLAQRRVGVVGVGSIGRRCAELFGAFGCDVYVTARSRPREPMNATFVSLEELLPLSDVLVLAVPLTESTRGLINSGRISQLPNGAIVVNVARGAVVDDAALARALRSKHIGGAALDVFDVEPLPISSPLRGFDSTLLSPHVAGGSAGARASIYSMTAQNVAGALRKQTIRWTL